MAVAARCEVPAELLAGARRRAGTVQPQHWRAVLTDSAPNDDAPSPAAAVARGATRGHAVASRGDAAMEGQGRRCKVARVAAEGAEPRDVHSLSVAEVGRVLVRRSRGHAGMRMRMRMRCQHS